MKNKIEIENYSKNIKQYLVLSGRELGTDMRKYFELDKKDLNKEKYEVIFPKNIVSITTSFFLALFGKSVRHMETKDKFISKYNFDENKNLKSNIDDGISDALNNVDGLSE